MKMCTVPVARQVNPPSVVTGQVGAAWPVADARTTAGGQRQPGNGYAVLGLNIWNAKMFATETACRFPGAVAGTALARATGRTGEPGRFGGGHAGPANATGAVTDTTSGYSQPYLSRGTPTNDVSIDRVHRRARKGPPVEMSQSNGVDA